MEYIVNFFKLFVICELTLYIFLKVNASKDITIFKVIFNLITNIFVAVMYSLLYNSFNNFTLIIFCVIIYGLIGSCYMAEENDNFWVSYLFSFAVAYFIYVAAVFSASIVMLFIPKYQFVYGLLSIFLITFFTLIITLLIFKTRRLKNGVNFIKNFNGSRYTVFVLVVIFGIILLLYDILQRDFNTSLLRVIPFTVLIICIAFSIVVYKLITKHYKRNMRDRTIAIQKEEIDANVKVIEELKEQNLKLSTTIHKYNHRLSALESSIKRVMDRSNAEFASELSIVLEQTKTVTTQFADETKVKVELPSTNVVAIDNMLEYMRNEAAKCNIDFTLKLSDSIKPLLEKHVSEDKFETLLADHIKDAIIAINAKNTGYKSIMVLIGAVQGAYELSIYDTGVEFDIPTLLKLGTEPVTTHKDNGGSGLGFMTTFETLKYSKASLVIEEYDTNVTNYTKSVTIRFDGKCEYRIYSYRAEEINKACSGRKIIIKNI